MSNYAILAWQPLLRPPTPSDKPCAEIGALSVPLKALACRNQMTSVTVLVTSDEPVEAARLIFSDLASDAGRIASDNVTARQIGTVPTPEAGMVCDPLFEVDEFSFDGCVSFYVTIRIPAGVPAGTYDGTVALLVNGDDVAVNQIEIEVADVDLPDVRDWDFFLNVWMNPGSIARWHGVEVWSDEHFELMKPYVEDLAAHGQKSVVVPICYQPWGTQTRDPYPNAVKCVKRGDRYEFDFSIFDRYVEMHEDCGIDRAIHCYSIVQGPGNTDQSVIQYTDVGTSEEKLLVTKFGDEEYTLFWSAMLVDLVDHLTLKGWLHRTHIGLDEKAPAELSGKLIAFVNRYAPELKLAYAGRADDILASQVEDLSIQIAFDERGVTTTAPPERAAVGVKRLLDPNHICHITNSCLERVMTTFYVCCGPAFPNTFLFSPLVESRMLPLLAAQGGFDGLLRWSYNDWTDDPFQHPEQAPWPTGDIFFVYPGERGPVSSLRWEQLREGIYDYELAIIASANLTTSDEMVDYEQAMTLACRNVDGRKKSIGDIEIARRLLIPIAEHQTEQ